MGRRQYKNLRLLIKIVHNYGNMKQVLGICERTRENNSLGIKIQVHGAKNI